MTINTRGVAELVHFTTNHGVLGALFTRYVRSRQRLEGDRMVEYLFRPNSKFRKDAAYLDYVSLSIERINSHFYGISSGSWHGSEDIFWVVLSFDPEIMNHEGVIFSTTNNIYTSVRRGLGTAGYAALYEQRVAHWNGRYVDRQADLPASWPTCEQAELLYPGEIATQFLRRVYTRSSLEQSEVKGFLKATFHDDIEVVVDASRFERRGI